MRPYGEVYHGLRLRPGEYRKGYRLDAGITRRPASLLYMRAGVSAVGCMPLLDGGLNSKEPLYVSSYLLKLAGVNMKNITHAPPTCPQPMKGDFDGNMTKTV